MNEIPALLMRYARDMCTYALLSAALVGVCVEILVDIPNKALDI